MILVCGTDFSEPAGRAARVAAGLACRAGAALHLVHAVSTTRAERALAGYQEALRDLERERLDTEARLLAERGATVVPQLVTGTPDEAILEYARKVEASLLVLAAMGARAPTRWRLGTVAERAALASQVPVLVVRDSGPFEAWARGDRPLRVVAGVDPEDFAQPVVGWIGELRRWGPCDATFAYVYWPPVERARLGFPGQVDFVHGDPEVEALLGREIKARIGELPGTGELRAVARMGLGRPADHLVQLADAERADLLVVGAHHRHGLARLVHGSVSTGVLHTASMSVVFVPFSAAEEAGEPRVVARPHAVLAATDLSELGDRAVANAFAMVASGGTVHALHVVEPPRGRTIVGGVSEGLEPAAPRSRTHGEAAERLRALAPVDASPRGVELRVEVVEAHNVVEAICLAAERLDADLVCIGSHGRSSLAGAFLGSVAHGVVARSHRPVLLVPRRTR